MIPVNEPLLPGNESKYIQDCISTGWISSAGKYIDRFEKEWAAYCGRKHGVAVANGTVALELAVSVLNLPPGSEVILPSFTIVSCLEAVLRNGLEPVLVDSDPRTYCMDVEEVRRKINERTAAIMPVHIYGHPVDMSLILELARKHDLRIVEDAAEAHGAECYIKQRTEDGGQRTDGNGNKQIKDSNGKWRRCGSFGEVSCFSFYANKNITCGEGGMVLTDDEQLAELLRSRRNLCFGHKERFLHEDRGWNFRMTNLQAAIGCAQLEKIDHFIKRKLEMAARYNEGLRDLPLQIPHVEPWARTSVWMYAIVLDDAIPFDASEFAKRLMDFGVQSRPFFLGMHEQPVYQRLGLFKDCHLPVTERIGRRGLYLPSGQAITDEQIEHVCNAVHDVFK
jgi:perosamine synthetase